MPNEVSKVSQSNNCPDTYINCQSISYKSGPAYAVQPIIYDSKDYSIVGNTWIPIKDDNIQSKSSSQAIKSPQDEDGEMEDESAPGKEQLYRNLTTLGRTTCNCKRSKCSKMYCECFQARQKCIETCKCVGCENTSQESPQQLNNLEEKRCHCKKTSCSKKYCYCYNAGLLCSEACKCSKCYNGGEACRSKSIGGTQLDMVDPDLKDDTKRRYRSQMEIDEIDGKINYIMKLVPKQYLQGVLNFLQYWLT